MVIRKHKSHKKQSKKTNFSKKRKTNNRKSYKSRKNNKRYTRKVKGGVYDKEQMIGDIEKIGDIKTGLFPRELAEKIYNIASIFKPESKEELIKAVDEWCSNKEEAINKYGQISTWDTSLIKDMSTLFSEKLNFNEDISNWDVSKVENMSKMFEYAKSFNQPLNNWNVSNVKDMEGMFRRAFSFNQNLNNWNVSNVKNMSYMFDNSNMEELPEWYLRR